ncbi:unnamed protein product [Ectocarpus sp. 12 AP-2014]
MYDKLRVCYNSFRPSGSRAVPRLEEWHGVDAFCDDLHCRVTEGVVASEHVKVSSASFVYSIDACDGTKGMEGSKGEATILGHVITELSEGGSFMEETGDHGIGAQDWLDVTHAMLGAL